jgi:hypothetical protein
VRPSLLGVRDTILGAATVVSVVAFIAATGLRNVLPGLLIIAMVTAAESSILFVARITVTPETVTYRDYNGRRNAVTRSKVGTVQIFSYWIALRDNAGVTAVRIRPFFRRRQLEELARALNVPLLDRRKHHRGLEHA